MKCNATKRIRNHNCDVAVLCKRSSFASSSQLPWDSSPAFSPLFPDRKNGFQRYFDMLQRSCKCIPLSHVCIVQKLLFLLPFSLSTLGFSALLNSRQLRCTRHSSVFELASFPFIFGCSCPVFFTIWQFLRDMNNVVKGALKRFLARWR